MEYSTPIAVDFNLDGKSEVLIWEYRGSKVFLLEDTKLELWKEFDNEILGAMGFNDKVVIIETYDADETLHLLDGSKNELPGWPKEGQFTNQIVVADVNDDGKLEFLVATADEIRRYGGEGVDGIRIFNEEGLQGIIEGRFEGISVGDITGDGELEIAAITAQPHVWSVTEHGGSQSLGIYLFDSDHEVMPGWPKYPMTYGYPYFSKPTVSGAEIAVAASDKIYVWNVNGSEVFNIPADSDDRWHIDAPLFIGNLLFVSSGKKIYAFENGKALDGWPVPRESNSNFVYGHSLTSANIMGDSDPEILVAGEDGLRILNIEGSILASFQMDGHTRTPQVTDFDGDAILDMIVVSDSEPEVEGKPLLIFCSNCEVPALCTEKLPSRREHPTTSPEPKCAKTGEESYKLGNCDDGRDNDCDGLTDIDAECVKRPVYLILSQKRGLISKYGSEGANKIMKKIDEMAEAKEAAGFEAVVKYMDEVDTGMFGDVFSDGLLDTSSEYKIHQLGTHYYHNLFGGVQVSGESYFDSKEKEKRIDKDRVRLLLNTQTIGKELNPEYVLIVGGDDVFPYQRYSQISHNVELNEGRTMIELAINPFGRVYTTLTDDFYTDIDQDENNVPDIPIGRISDAKYPSLGAWLLEIILNDTIQETKKPRPISRHVDYYVDKEFLTPSLLFEGNAVARELSQKSYVTPHLSAPFEFIVGQDTSNFNQTNLAKLKSTFSNRDIMVIDAHGNENGVQQHFGSSLVKGGSGPYMFGAIGSYKLGNSGGFVLSLACHGGKVENRNSTAALAVLLPAQKVAKGYVGSTQSIEKYSAAVFGKFFTEHAQSSETMGDVFVNAKRDAYSEIASELWHKLEEFLPITNNLYTHHTLHGFTYFGDPSIQIGGS